MNQPFPPQVRVTARLRPARKHLVNIVGLGIWASGAAWLLFHYFLQTKGAFGPEPNPIEPWWLKLHGAFAFATLWVFGLLWGAHVVHGWALRRRRCSGGALFAVLCELIVSGYLLYYAGSDQTRAAISTMHWATGLGVAPLYLAHRLMKTLRS